jgi:hypothetical protein
VENLVEIVSLAASGRNVWKRFARARKQLIDREITLEKPNADRANEANSGGAIRGIGVIRGIRDLFWMLFPGFSRCESAVTAK